MYGEAWLDTGKIIELLCADFVRFVAIAPHLVHNWVIIMSKMMRILRSPYNADHWRDIEGYANLVRRYIEEKDEHVSGK